MHKTSSTEFRSHAAQFLTLAEKGEIVIIIRHGEAVAKLSPVSAKDLNYSWKEPALRLKIKGLSLSEQLLKDRNEDIE